MRKTVSFAVVHFTVAFTLAYMFTGSVLVGGALALLEPTLNTLAFHVHERVWDRIDSGRLRWMSALKFFAARHPKFSN